MGESALALKTISILLRLSLRLLTPTALIALGVDRSKALLDSAGHPGRPIWQSMSGATAEKASPLESVSSRLKPARYPAVPNAVLHGWARGRGLEPFYYAFSVDEWAGAARCGWDYPHKPLHFMRYSQ
jgi:hypothetical protein